MPQPTFQKGPNLPWTRTDVEEFFATASERQRATVAFPAAFLAALGFFRRHPGGEPDKELVGYTYRQHRYNPKLPLHQAEIDLFPVFDPKGSWHFEYGTWCSEGYMLPTPKPEDLAGDISHAINKGIVVWRPLIAVPWETAKIDPPITGDTAYSGEFSPADTHSEEASDASDDVKSTSENVANLFDFARECRAQVAVLKDLGVQESTQRAVRESLALALGLRLIEIA